MAGLIPQSFINDLLDRVDIVDVIDSRLDLRKKGKNYSALCPFHQENTPSFSVNPDKQFYYCFGCGAGGNAIGFIMEYERVDFRAAVDELAKKAGVEVPSSGGGDPQQDKKRQNLYNLLNRAQRFYQHQLKHHPAKQQAVDYLKARGLSGEIAKQFAIGYAPEGWDNLSQAFTDKDESALIEGGLLIRKDNNKGSYDRFRQRIIFPIRDTRGRTIAFGGRVLDDQKPKYLNSPETPVFHKGRELYGLYEAKQANRSLSRVLIVEGYMDVVALAQFDISYAVATLGTATSTEHLEKLFKLVPEVIFCFDGDNAGRAAAERALNTALPIMTDGRQIRFLFLPEGEDPDTIVRQEGKEAFETRLEQALPLTDFFFEHLSTGINTSALDGKVRFANEALKQMRAMPQGLLYGMMVEQLAKLTEIPTARLQAIAEETNSSTGSQNKSSSEPPNISPPPPDDYPPDYLNESPPAVGYTTPMPRPEKPHPTHTQVLSLAKQAACILLHQPALAADVKDIHALAELDEPDMYLLTELLRLLQDQPNLSTGHIMGHFAGLEANEDIALLMAIDLLLEENALADQFRDILQTLLGRQSEARLQHLIDRSKEQSLSTEERQELQRLLEQVLGQKTPKNS